MTKFKVGQVVRVKGQRRKAIIQDFYADIEGGVILDRLILGFRVWNVENLRPWKKRKKSTK